MRIEDLLERSRDLVGQPLLHLEAPGEDVNDPGDLGKTNDLAVRQI